MATIREIVFDSEHPPALARFWAAVLDDYVVRPYDDAELARLASQGLSPETDPTVAVDGPGPTLFFQQVRERKTTKNRVHLDIAVADRRREVARLGAIGALIWREHDRFTVMQDPEGNEFCVVERR